MAAPHRSCLVGPVPFKDVNGDDDHMIARPDLRLQLYQDVWLFNDLVPGFIAVQQRFIPRPGDVLLASPPKCGTTWLKALSFATMARTAYPLSDADHPLLRLNPHECVTFMEALFNAGQEAKLEALPSPRLLHTHMHHSMLPRSLADNPDCKIVFVCREPKDMLVSAWHFIKDAGLGISSLSDLFELACEGKNVYGPVWNHLLGYWRASKATPERVLFLRYEEMLADPVSTVRGLARFLGVPFTPTEEAAGLPMDIAKMCSIDMMKGLDANKTGSSRNFIQFPHETFFRKGVVGHWVNHITPDMARRIDAIFEEKLRGSGLTFSS
ncbi:hypothetical protein ACQJBY_035754 [Aegilops geniculata]